MIISFRYSFFTLYYSLRWLHFEVFNMFLKKEDKFYTHLRNLSANLMESADFFDKYKINGKQDLEEFASKMKFYEHKGDNLVHQIIHDLNKVFITPIEREDILSLATHIDDVLDGMEGTAALFYLYEIPRADDYMVKFVDFIHRCVVEINAAIDLLVNKKLIDMREHIIRIKEYESNCDELRRDSIRYLFQNETDPFRLIQYKEIYEELEAISDHCESVANVFEAIIMKNV